MGFFPPNMYDPQINMIRKPFVLNTEQLKDKFLQILQTDSKK